jgi:erythritol transport system ATP-binding protein
MGARRTIAGEVTIRGTVENAATIRSRLRAGLALVPEDRQRDGLVQTMSVKDNVVLSILTRLARSGLLGRGRQADAAAGKVRELAIKIPGLGASVTALSGGNQQKVVLARALLIDPVVLLLDEPTRGIDIGAKSQIAAIMADLAGRGFGVLFISSELAEVIAMADRVLVMAKGRITAELSAAEVTEEKLVTASASESVLEGIS